MDAALCFLSLVDASIISHQQVLGNFDLSTLNVEPMVVTDGLAGDELLEPGLGERLEAPDVVPAAQGSDLLPVLMDAAAGVKAEETLPFLVQDGAAIVIVVVGEGESLARNVEAVDDLFRCVHVCSPIFV